MNGNSAPEIVLAAHDRSRLGLLSGYIAASACPAMRMLAGELARARVVAPADIPPDTVTMGSAVRYRDGETGQIFTVTLVYPEAEDRAASRISVLSPEGAALIGLSEGQSIRYVTPAGRRKWLVVLSVLSQPIYEDEDRGIGPPAAGGAPLPERP